MARPTLMRSLRILIRSSVLLISSRMRFFWLSQICRAYGTYGAITSAPLKGKEFISAGARSNAVGASTDDKIQPRLILSLKVVYKF